MKKGMKIYFVGAGPGDPELVTVKGARLLTEADLVVYAGSLVNPALVEGLAARLVDSNKITSRRSTGSCSMPSKRARGW
jgi:precorrin-4/cobalt-precorrin-4 C11-methyltransferase